MKEKGFTLIELLAVIVILAIIALIATPIILNIISDAKEESNERSIELYASAVKNAIAKYQLNNTSAPTSFDQLDIEYDGDVVCTTEELYEDGSIYLANCTVNGDAVDYTYGIKQPACTYTDEDNSGTINLSDVVTCGTESFYVMSNESNEITMLSMYNLYVGSSVTLYSSGDWEAKLLENPTGIQSELSEEYIGNGITMLYGTVEYDGNGAHYDVNGVPTYVYGSNSYIYEYVTQYEKYLKDNGVINPVAKLISYEQLEILGCDYSNNTCLSAPRWVHSTTYWTGFASYDSVAGDDRVYSVTSAGKYGFYGPALAAGNGVRPVITISTSDIK